MKMSVEAKGLLAEADRILKEAEILAPSSSVLPKVVVSDKKTRGRPKKTVSVA
jgi:hypothetical protein